MPKPTPQTPSTPPPPPPPQEKTWVDDITDGYAQFTSTISENVTKPVCDLLHQIPIEQWNKEYFQPFNAKYQQWPTCMANFKQQYILPKGNENQRLICLGLTTLALVALTRRCSPGPLRIVRNSFVTYFGLGLFIAPEIYNPLLIDKRDTNEKQTKQ